MSGGLALRSARRLLLTTILLSALVGAVSLPTEVSGEAQGSSLGAAGTAAPVANFTASLNRLVELVAAGGAGLLALVWSRVAISWFSHDLSKKVQARDRARDALIGTLVFTAAITGLVWGLAQWVLTGA